MSNIANIMHLDLTIRNILVTDYIDIDDDKRFRVKIGGIPTFSRILKKLDFGLSKVAQELFNVKLKFQPRFSAPELWTGTRLTPKADVWPFGVIIWQLYTKQEPYLGMEAISQGERLRAPDPSCDCPNWMYLLLLRCWSVDPQRRPEFSEISAKILEELDSVGPNPNAIRLSRSSYRCKNM
jgi:serine/threonine protein kinase